MRTKKISLTNKLKRTEKIEIEVKFIFTFLLAFWFFIIYIYTWIIYILCWSIYDRDHQHYQQDAFLCIWKSKEKYKLLWCLYFVVIGNVLLLLLLFNFIIEFYIRFLYWPHILFYTLVDVVRLARSIFNVHWWCHLPREYWCSCSVSVTLPSDYFIKNVYFIW